MIAEALMFIVIASGPELPAPIQIGPKQLRRSAKLQLLKILNWYWTKVVQLFTDQRFQYKQKMQSVEHGRCQRFTSISNYRNDLNWNIQQQMERDNAQS